jgi:cytochrome c6
MHPLAGKKNLRWYGGEEFMSETRVARVFAIAIFLAVATSLGIGQSANNSAVSLYKTNCVSCHGPDGRGSAVGKSLNAADFHSVQIQQQSDAQLATVIAEGRGNMPPFGTRLSKDQIDALVKYIRTLGKAK